MQDEARCSFNGDDTRIETRSSSFGIRPYHQSLKPTNDTSLVTDKRLTNDEKNKGDIMFKNRLIIGGTLLWFALWLPSFAISETKQTYQIPWSVLNEGGKTEETTSASYKLKDAIGQPVIGICESASYKAYIGFWTPKPLGVVGVEEKFVETEIHPLVYNLSQNYPNPMSNVTKIGYTLPTTGWVSMRIYNISGQLVKMLVDESEEPGTYRISWDGRDEKGERAAPGVYFYKFEIGDYKSTKKMILLR